MPKYDGVYKDSKGRWDFKVWLGRDPLTGRQQQLTSATAADAARERRKALDRLEDRPQTATLPVSLTVADLLDLYLDGLDADERLSAKTRFDYRHNAGSTSGRGSGRRRSGNSPPR